MGTLLLGVLPAASCTNAPGSCTLSGKFICGPGSTSFKRLSIDSFLIELVLCSLKNSLYGVGFPTGESVGNPQIHELFVFAVSSVFP